MRKTQFDRLIEEVTDLVDALQSLFPAPEASQRQLCKAELPDMGDESFIILRNISCGNDELWKEVSAETLDDRAVLEEYQERWPGRATHEERLLGTWT